jgi:hypothetical protein
MPSTAKPSSRRRSRTESGVYAFMQKPLGLWLLSTIFVSLGSGLYTVWNSHRTTEEARRAVVQRLDIEIGYRLNLYDLSDNTIVIQPPDGLSINDRIPAKDSLLFLQKYIGPPAKGEGVFVEYENRGLLALLAELSANLSGRERQCVNSAMKVLQLLTIKAKGAGVGINVPSIHVALVEVSKHRWGVSPKLAEYFRRQQPGQVDSEGRKHKLFCGAYYAGLPDPE